MRHNTTTTQIVTALRQAFCRTAIPDIIWSDGGPQFTSVKFNQFVQQWGFLHKISSPYHPQSNRKIESTVKSMKKSFFWIRTNSVVPSFSTETLLLEMTDYPQLRSYMGILPKIPFLPIAAHFPKSGNAQQKKSRNRPRTHRSPPQSTTMHMHTTSQNLTLTPTLLSNIPTQNCGTLTASSHTSHPTGDITLKPLVDVC